MNAEPPILPAELPPPLPLAGPRERLMARIMFFGACVTVLPTAALTVWSCFLIYIVFPVIITGLLNWCGWWMLINYFRRGWDRPVKAQPQRVWITSMIFNGLGLLALATWTLNFGTRGSDDSMLALMLLCDGWLLFATIASGVSVLELQSARLAEAQTQGGAA